MTDFFHGWCFCIFQLACCSFFFSLFLLIAHSLIGLKPAPCCHHEMWIRQDSDTLHSAQSGHIQTKTTFFPKTEVKSVLSCGQTARLRLHAAAARPRRRSTDLRSVLIPERLSHQARISASVNAMRILNTGTEVEAAVADALVRAQMWRSCQSLCVCTDERISADARRKCSSSVAPAETSNVAVKFVYFSS